MKIVRNDAGLFLEVSRHLLAQGVCVRFRAGGASMQPAIADGDAVVLAPVSAVAVRPGDVVLYCRGLRSIAHRVVRISRAKQNVTALLLCGDAAEACDAPVRPHDVLGKVIAVEPGECRARVRSLPARLRQWLRIAAASAGRPFGISAS